MYVTENRDPGALLVGEVDVRPGDLLRIAGEHRPRRVSAVFGNPPRTHAACKGHGPFPVGRVEWELVSGEDLAPTEAAPSKGTRRSDRTTSGTPAAALPEVLSPSLQWSGLIREAANLLLIGFDSAWTVRNRGGLVALRLRGGRAELVFGPAPCSFEEALQEIERWRGEGQILLALDQPLIVRNEGGRRPAESVVAHVIRRHFGGVQPANTSRKGMFDLDAPVWSFLESLGPHTTDPFARPSVDAPMAVFEVFPALATLGLFDELWSRRLLRYNPQRRETFLPSDWKTLARSLERILGELEIEDLRAWSARVAEARPTKALQDQIDACLCLLVALLRHAAPERLAVVGSLNSGYIVTPAAGELLAELREDALVEGVPLQRLG